VPFFTNASEEFISLCVTLLKFQVFLPGDFIFKRGDKGDRMYFIVRGIVDILTTDEFVATSLTDGSHFGGKWFL
jgi:CRP-like cAMP-binding protein